MNRSDISDLIGTARGFDDRIEPVMTPYLDPTDPEGRRVIEDVRIKAWLLVLGDIDAGLALQGLAELYGEPQMLRLQPGHIREAAEKVRRRNVDRVDLSQLLPPDGIGGEHGEESRTAQWRQAAVDAIGRGATVEEAQDHADRALRVKRRQLGPPVRRLVLTELPPGLRRATAGEASA